MMEYRLQTTAVLAALALVACSTVDTDATWVAGHYSQQGWAGAYVNGVLQVTGEVATPITPVKGPSVYCVLQSYTSHYDDDQSGLRHKFWDEWYVGGTVESGTLPPGLSMDENGTITGIPLQRGNWIVTLRAGNENCVGQPVIGQSQQVIFKIGGSGVVYQ
jgi:hypothetical protein